MTQEQENDLLLMLADWKAQQADMRQAIDAATRLAGGDLPNWDRPVIWGKGEH